MRGCGDLPRSSEPARYDQTCTTKGWYTQIRKQDILRTSCVLFSRVIRRSCACCSAVAMAHEYEFGGPVGALGIIFGLPAVIYFLFFACG